jgi:hypothetical protein
MQCIAFDTRKRCTWALVQNETGKHSSLLPLPSSLLPTTYSPLVSPWSFPHHSSPITLHCLLPLDKQRAFRDLPRNSLSQILARSTALVYQLIGDMRVDEPAAMA